jgi:hypothetical protein
MSQEQSGNIGGAQEGFEAGAGGATEEDELFDLVIPPGTPNKIIGDITEKFEVQLVERTEKLNFANMDGEERNLLAFRGKLDVMKEVEKYFYTKMKEFIGDN